MAEYTHSPMMISFSLLVSRDSIDDMFQSQSLGSRGYGILILNSYKNIFDMSNVNFLDKIKR